MAMLDREKFAKVVRLLRSTTHLGERDAARQRAEAMAAAEGMTFEEAFRMERQAMTGRRQTKCPAPGQKGGASGRSSAFGYPPSQSATSAVVELPIACGSSNVA